MKLISMKLEKKKSDNKDVAACSPEGSGQPEFPWGLRITLETEQVKKLSTLKDSEVGEEIMLQAIGKIISIRKEEMQNEKTIKDRHTVEIQLTAINVSSEADFDKGFKEAVGRD
ncbi:MAG: capsid staple protein [Candidatus Omnitrophota bacterium]